jgi:hypothetical protein
MPTREREGAKMQLKTLSREAVDRFITGVKNDKGQAPWDLEECKKVRDWLLASEPITNQFHAAQLKVQLEGGDFMDFLGSWCVFMFQLGREYELKAMLAAAKSDSVKITAL